MPSRSRGKVRLWWFRLTRRYTGPHVDWVTVRTLDGRTVYEQRIRDA